MTHKQQLIKEARESYIKKFGLCDREGKNCGCDKEIKFIEKLVSTTYDQAMKNTLEDVMIIMEKEAETRQMYHSKERIIKYARDNGIDLSASPKEE